MGGYANFLKIINDPSHEEHKEMLTWAGGSFDPERFDPEGVQFDEPWIRWKVAYLDDEEAYGTLMEARCQTVDVRPVTHVNRKGDTCYLHSRKNKKGNATYHFSKKEEGTLVHAIPDGFEIYEDPDARVYLRRIPDKVITDMEEALVNSAVKAAGFSDFIVEAKKNAITVFLSDLGEEWWLELLDTMGLPSIPLPEGLDIRKLLSKFPIFREPPEELLKKIQSYTPMMRFVLKDPVKREFDVERMCFSGSIDDWIYVDGPDDLKRLVNRYCRHLGRDSFYEL